MKRLSIILTAFIGLSLIGCSSAYLKKESEKTAYLEFRVGIPVPPKETCDALRKLKEFCPSEKYNIELLGSDWGGQYYRVFKMRIYCSGAEDNGIDPKDDSYFFNIIKERIHPPECK